MVASSAIKLFTPLTLGGKNPVQLLHRVAMAPLTRLRSGEEGIPPSFAAKYYAQRATNGGLIIAEATSINPTSRGYWGTPGLFNQAQVNAWKPVTKAVHDKGGKIFVQLWHTGRVGHPLNQPNGVLPVSSSAESMDNVNSWAVTREGRQKYVTPRALETDEIPGIVEDYRKAAVNAIEAGFDGVELHSANGYLLEQFLCDGVNKRTDKYGGSIENRARFLFEALGAITSSLDSSKVAIRLSPFGVTFGCTDSTPEATYGYVVKKLNDYNLAYVHVVEPGGGHHAKGPLVPATGVTSHIRPLYNGVLITASGYNRESAIQVVDDNKADIVAFGRDFIGTPDLVKRLQIGAPLNKYDQKTFYLGGEEGYTDYPFLEEVEEATA
uniref:NADH:flavin oxidoreductase/NADH oxidase N-terminal domain-containing protein n=1 Tax=Globisporangium ultimum (strain ATCC 200006 / CBS 805.95 / DAOM BR144) TaxID=431595 RepID=K3WA76_GLOUD